MDLRSFQTFQQVVRQGSFVRAAEVLNYAQSTVTMQVQKLESDYGMQLIERNGKTVKLTEAGRLFYEQSVDILQRAESLQRGLNGLRLGEAGHIRLGATEPAASYRLPAVVEQFMAEYPNVQISIDIAGTPILSEKLLSGELDLAICSTPGSADELLFEPLYQEPFVVLLPADHPLAKYSLIELKDLYGHRMLITSTTCPYRKKLESVLQEAGEAQVDTMEIGSMTALVAYAERGLGIALVPRILAERAGSHTVMRSLGHTGLIDMTIGLLFKPVFFPPGKACANLAQALRFQLGIENNEVAHESNLEQID